MSKVLLAFVTSFCALMLLAASCEKPVINNPTGVGGFINDPWATGGTVSAAGANPLATGGALVAIAGAGPVCADYERPACDPAGVHKLNPPNRKLLGRRHGPVTKHVKSKYLMLGDLCNQFWGQNDKTALNQGDVGRCTGYATSKVYGTQPFKGHATAKLGDELYHWATILDSYPGTWNVDGSGQDTGSDGASVMKAAITKISPPLFVSSKTIYDFVEFQQAIQKGPCIFGSNWYTSMYNPTRCGEAQIGALDIVEGGHEYGALGIDYDLKVVWFVNSWDQDFGLTMKSTGHGGYFYITFGNVVRLLNEDGSFDCPTPPVQLDGWASKPENDVRLIAMGESS